MSKTKIGYNRRTAFWFCLISPMILIILSIFKNFDSGIISDYMYFCFGVISVILGSKANDTIQKFKNKGESE